LTPKQTNATFESVGEPIGPSEAARRLGVSTRTVQRWLREGRLPAVRVGERVKVDSAAFAEAPSEGRAQRRIERLLVANRGELVVRIARTARQLGIATLALAPDDQARAWWTSAADEIVPLRGSYLDIDAVLAAAIAARADAIHPGYGFLAENAEFARAVIAAGIAWVGPGPAAMRALGDKAAARRVAASIGVPVLPGYDGDDQSDARLLREARHIGFPVLVKPSAGGGGKGMHVLERARDFDETVARARREAKSSFGDDRLILERYLARPRHVEVQLLADEHGNVVHLGERECSLQRRHQKVIEEAPSPAVAAATRARLGDAAISLAHAAGYTSAGTAEFLLSDDGEFYFLELNARLQVEHPVTELVTGRDLVADQLRIAAGEELGFAQSDVTLSGHAIEARLYAEDPWHEFVPATGEVLEARWPTAEGMRVDRGIGVTDVVGTRYDPLLAKLVAFAADRSEALRRLDEMLIVTSVIGVTNNKGFLRWLVEDMDVRAGRMWTTFIDERWQPNEPEIPDDAWTAAARALIADRTHAGFRLNAAPTARLSIGSETRSVAVQGGASAPFVRLADGSVVLDLAGRSYRAALAAAPTVEAALRGASHEGAHAASIVAPMPGTVISVGVADGDDVEAGQVLVVLEAMKMENNVPAPAAGRVARVLVGPGQQVQRSEILVELD
jgi:acetyl-CoA/propionyl-CoA carboxylase biotin carboxyl carrier protein